MKILHSKKQLAALYMLGFFIGIAYVNFLVRRYDSGVEIFGDHVLSIYKDTKIIAEEFIFYLIRMRIIPFVLLLCLVFTKLRKIATVLCTVWTGFSCGMLLSTAAIEKGMAGCMICLGAVFPQILCYILAYFIVIWYGYTFPKTRWNMQKSLFVCITMGVGIILELYVNPVIMKHMLHLILK